MHEDLENKIADLQAQIERVRAITETFQHCLDVKEAFVGSHEISIYPSVEFGNKKVLMYVSNCKALEAIVPVIRMLRKLGHRTTRSYTDSAASSSRSYFLDEIDIEVFLARNTDAKCKYVKVGVKEVDVFELRCDPEVAV